MYEYLIKNAKIYDGTGNKPYVADVFLQEGKIAAIGQGLKRENLPVQNSGCYGEIDASGLCLSAGFIDTHSHSDYQLFVTPDRAGKVLSGVTTEITGQCGSSRAPYLSTMPDDAKNYLKAVYGSGNRSPFFETFAAELDEMGKQPLGPNQATFVGHRLIRASVIGMENRKATPAELSRMEGYVEEGMQAGCFGFTTGMVYAPGSFGDTDELVALAKVAAKYGGYYTTHIRDEAFRVKEAVAEAIEIARRAEIPLNISHLKVQYPQNWPMQEEVLQMIDDAAASGMDITFDVYPYEASSANILSMLPPSYNCHSADWIAEKLTGRDNVEIFRDKIMNPTEKWENAFKNAGPDRILIVGAPVTRDAIGLNIAQYAEKRGIDALEAFAELVAKNRCDVTTIRFTMSNENIAKLYAHPRCMVGTDGLYTSGNELAHPRFFGTFPRYLGRFVRERGVLSFEEAIHRLTGMPADRYKLDGKGYVKTGYDADLVLFDENTIIDHADFLTPYEPGEGIKGVFIGGGIAAWDNHFTGLANGKVILHKY